MTFNAPSARAPSLARLSLACLSAAVFAAGCESLPDDETLDNNALENVLGLLCIDEDCIDGQADILVFFEPVNVSFPHELIYPGARLHVSGTEWDCGDSPCSTDSVFMRTLDTNELVAASFGNPVPNEATTPNSALAPLYIESEDQMLCAPSDAGCQDNTVNQRRSIDVLSSQSQNFARLLDGSNGWAPGGYHVSVDDWMYSNASCQLSLRDGLVTIIRACIADHEEECPDADVADSCEARTGPYDYIDAYLLSDEGDVYGDYDAQCEVLSTSSQQLNGRTRTSVYLDCLFTLWPG